MKVKKRCVTKYIPPNAAQTPLIITSCHLHKNKDGFQQRITEKKKTGMSLLLSCFFHTMPLFCWSKGFFEFLVVLFFEEPK